MKVKLFSVIMLLMFLIPCNMAYPLSDLSIDTPDKIIAGNSHLINIDYSNERGNSIDTRLGFNTFNISSYNEVNISLKVNGEAVPVNQRNPGHFLSKNFTSNKGENNITINLSTNIALKPMTYTYNITIFTEDMKEKEKRTAYSSGGRIIVPTPTPTISPTASPTLTPTPETTPTLTETPIQTVTKVETPTPNATATKTEEPFVIPGFNFLFAFVGMIVVAYLIRRK